MLVVARTLLRAASSASAEGAGGSRRAGASSEGVGAPSRRAAERGADPRREKATVRGEDERTRTSHPRARETPGWAPRRARVEATPRASASADPLERRVMPRVVTAPRVLARKPPGRAQARYFMLLRTMKDLFGANHETVARIASGPSSHAPTRRPRSRARMMAKVFALTAALALRRGARRARARAASAAANPPVAPVVRPPLPASARAISFPGPATRHPIDRASPRP